MDHQRCREAVSARLDGEETGQDDAAVDEHLAACADCRAAADRVAVVTRLVRTRPIEQAPDVVDRVMAATARRGPGLPMLQPDCGCAATCACGCQDGAACRCGPRAA